MNLYFECRSGISGDMAVAALLDLGASVEKLENALKSINLEDEFKYEITKKSVNSIMATDFNVILPQSHAGHNNTICNKQHTHNEEHFEHYHVHRNLDDVNKIIEKSASSPSAKALAKKIFKIVAQAEGKVHGKSLDMVHFHEIGAIDSIVDIISFAVLFDDLNPENTYFTVLTEGSGSVTCQHGVLPVPVPAVCEITSAFNIPLKIIDNDGEMVTPTGAAIAAALYTGKKLPDEIIIEKVGYGAGKRPYSNPVLRVIQFR